MPDHADFLSNYEQRPLSIAEGSGLKPSGLVLGKGPNGLEVAVARSDSQPSLSTLRAVWKGRLAGRVSPLLLIALYDKKAALCGPTGEQPPAFTGLDQERVERICSTALDEPDRHAAVRFLRSVLPQLEPEARVSGVRNEGLFATHELQFGVPRRKDWGAVREKAQSVLRHRGHALIKSLGFSVETLPGAASILRSADTKLAVAVFLERNESPDSPQTRFSNLSAVSYALAQADAENLDYVVIAAGSALRLYSSRTGVGPGRRGRTETFVEVHLDILPAHDAGYLWLLFSVDALRRGGTVEQVLDDSSRYAARLGERLRDRVYGSVVPPLAEGLMQARGLKSPTAEELAQTYQVALVVLFRLLFIAYAEDKDLLPYKTNSLYKDRSLKQKANDLIRTLKSKTSFGQDTIYWEEIDHIFRAVDQGRAEWGVPAYNGGLFSRKREVSPEGAVLSEIRLPDYVFGPVLTALLVDETPEGPGPVDFRSLGVREFGTIYEGLLENELSLAEMDLSLEKVKDQEQYRPVRPGDKVQVPKGRAYLHNRSGARKATGSYFTKHFAVEHLLELALEPALKGQLSRLDALSDREAAESFFDFRVADISMGSGHFLVAAVDRIERAYSTYLVSRPLPDVLNELSRLRKAALNALGPLGEGIEIEDTQLLRRQIARHCIYGVDLTTIAVELARLGLWVHTFVPGLPLSFLDHSLVVGNSLFGIATIDEANTWLREIAGPLYGHSAGELVGSASTAIQKLAQLSDADASEIQAARTALEEERTAVSCAAMLLDVLTASRIDDDARAAVFQNASHWKENLKSIDGSDAQILARTKMRAIPPFHFPIAFPEVFLRDRSGFDVIVGNPPWEKVRVEEHEFWARHSPGLRGLGKEKRDETITQLKAKRHDLVALWEQERAASEKLRDALRFLPGMNTGHPDLFRAFIWRFIQLAWQDGGRLGVVLPGDAFKIAGGADVRERLAISCSDVAPQMLTNKSEWVFDDVDPRKLIAFVTATVMRQKPDSIFHIAPEFHERGAWDRRDPADEVAVPMNVLREYSPTLVVPLLRKANSFELIETFMKSAALARHPVLRVRRVYADFETSKHDKQYWHAKKTKGDLNVYAGESFDIWQPDTGAYYAFTDAKTIQEAAHLKWSRAPRSSPYSELPKAWRFLPENHPIHFPRIAFRDVTNRTNTRTFVTALIPPQVVTVQTAPWVLWLESEHSKAHEAYLLGVLSSLPLDWWCRCFIEGHADQEAFNCLRIPDPRNRSKASKRIVALAGRLAAADDRFHQWAHDVGVECGKLEDNEKQEMIHELDAVVAHLYGLNDKQLAHVFETFHEGWDYEKRFAETLKHFVQWKKKL